MGSVTFNGLMGDTLRACFRTVSCMDMGIMCGKMAVGMKGITDLIRSTEKEPTLTLMEASTAESGKKVCNTESGSSSTQTLTTNAKGFGPSANSKNGLSMMVKISKRVIFRKMYNSDMHSRTPTAKFTLTNKNDLFYLIGYKR